MGRCKDCTWWIPSEVDGVPNEGLWTCSNPKFLRGYYNHEPQELPEDCIWLEGDEGWA